jgi:hypothetical protein
MTSCPPGRPGTATPRKTDWSDGKADSGYGVPDHKRKKQHKSSQDDIGAYPTGHTTTRVENGAKSKGPLGRRYFLANWEVDKNVYGNGLFNVKLGPFVDTGAIADSSGLFGSREWLWDTGAQCKIRVFGGMTVVLSYGRDLRGARNVFYGTVLAVTLCHSRTFEGWTHPWIFCKVCLLNDLKAIVSI